MAPVSTSSSAKQSLSSARPAAAVTVFVCANCARPGQMPDSGGRPRPTIPHFGWPFPVQEILVSCTGRIQPEHVLKVFESGADLVCVVGCEEDNCHYLEGSKRCARRVEYLRALLEEVGLGGDRLLLFRLSGTAAEDAALGCGQALPDCTIENEDPRVIAIREAVAEALGELRPNPLHVEPADEEIGLAYQEVDYSSEDSQD